MNILSSIRVRFAPSPTGFMHLGNVRAALINFLFSKQKQGTFILRIEDTDPQRNVDLNGSHIMADLAWLSLTYQEGPIIGGAHAPYYQSERSIIYQDYLTLLQEKNKVYRCFCTPEELENKRQRQIALKQPPRYDRTCLKLSPQEIEKNLAANKPYIWRFQLPDTNITITDLARGEVHYDLKHFSDTPLTRQDHTFTFIFANFVDDHAMGITHIFRGEDHLTNTAVQAALYHTFGAHVPLFWHLPIICNSEGKKLSKRDFGFSLSDLREAGYLPEAICNYLAIIGGGVFTQEVMSLDELSQHINFEAIASTGQIRYDIEKLNWLNHKWIARLSAHEIADRCFKYLKEAYPEMTLNVEQLTNLIAHIQTDLITLKDVVKELSYCFQKPNLDKQLVEEYYKTEYAPFIKNIMQDLAAGGELHQSITSQAKMLNVPTKNAYAIIRLALTGKPQGPSIKDLTAMLPSAECLSRLETLLKM